ncbi:MAG: sigma-54 dependent transcriptional regulator [Phycisphaerales bacterium]|nr:sigma-54 dependent transcriptional regulator [Phycisphaerales bacterium]
MADISAALAFAAIAGVGVVFVDRQGFVVEMSDAAAVLLGNTTTASGGVGGVGGEAAVAGPRQALTAWLDGVAGFLGRLDELGGEATLRAVSVRRSLRATHVDIVARPYAWTPIDGEAGGGSDRGDGLARAAWVLVLTDATGRVAAEGEASRLRAQIAAGERVTQEWNQGEDARTGGDRAAARDPYRMVGASPALKRVKDQVARVAKTSATVLIAGETGAGKELVARSVHQLSNRQSQSFVAVNCAAMPESLIESELFGHERGAFTGADKRRAGKFELADGGTLFLDEIAELPLQSQAKLLRVLQDGAFERVGGMETLKVDVRLVAATHRDLARLVERGRFREDLFYRLNVFKIHVPPLRERKEDLRLLVEHIHERVAERMGRPVLALSERSLRRVMAYSWPGNVRELSNAVERATLLAEGNELEVELPESPLKELPGMGPSGLATAVGGVGGERGSATRDILLDLTLEQLQRLHITHALESSGYQVFGEGGAAAKLDINPYTLLSRMDRYGIPRPRQMKRERKAGS